MEQNEYFTGEVPTAVLSFCKDFYGVTPVFPWEDFDAAVLKHESGKWFAIMMSVPFNRIDRKSDISAPVEIMNVKCDPVMIGSLLTEKGFYRAYHMNKEHWITILLDGSVDIEEIKPLLDLSYHLTEKKIRKKSK